jgi:DNA polymerase
VNPAVDAEALRELAELTAAVRTHVEWLVASGAAGVPRDRSGASARGAAANTPAPLTSAVEGPARARDTVEAAPSAPSMVEAPPRAAPSAAGAPPLAERTGPVPAVSPPARVAAPPAPAVVVAAPVAPVAAAPALDVTERGRRLELLAESIKSCTRCALHAGRTQTVFARGTGSSGLCFVGEGPGADEDAQGFPFVGKAGQLLDRMIEAMGFGRDDVYVCNIVKCRPPNNRKPEPEEMAACMPYLKEQLELLQPEVMVALGVTAVQGLFGTTEGITRLRGRWKLYGGRTPVMPTFHPAFLLRNPAAKREVWDDLQAVLCQMGRQPPKR